MPQMDFKVSRLPDGTYHVQDRVGAFLGQHHVHSKEGFDRWEKKRKSGEISIEAAPNCDCGMGVGFVKECNGKVWFNAAFGEKRLDEPAVVAQKTEEPISKPKEAAPEPVVPDAKKPNVWKKIVTPQVSEAKGGMMMKFLATAQVEGKLETHEFEHEKASPWKVKDFAAKKFFAALIKDKKPLEIWKSVSVEPIREKIERKAKAKAAKVVKAKAKKVAKKNGKKAVAVEAKKD